MWKSQGERSGLYGGCWNVYRPNHWRLSLTRLAVWGWVLWCKRMIPSDSIPGRSDFMARRNFCNVSALHFALIVAPRSRKSTSSGPMQSKKNVIVTLPVHLWTGFGFLWRGRTEVFPLLALPFALGIKMVAPPFVPCDDTWEKRILFLVVPLQMTHGRFLERKICYPLVNVADRLIKGTGTPHILSRV